MNIEEDLTSLKEIVAIRKERCHGFIESDSCLISTKRLENLLTAYEKEKEKNKKAEELYMQHNQMIIDILKECDYMIKNRYYMNDVAIRQYAEKIKHIAKYYIKEPEWTELKEGIKQ